MADGSDRSSNRGVVLVALTGLLSTVLAAFVGGALAQGAAEEQAYSARRNALNDQRREIYADYVFATETACAAADDRDAKALTAAANDVLHQQVRVQLLADDATRAAVDKFTNLLITDETTLIKACDLTTWGQLRDAFIKAAKKQIDE